MSPVRSVTYVSGRSKFPISTSLERPLPGQVHYSCGLFSLASEPKLVTMRAAAHAKESLRAGQLAEDPALFEAQRWFARERGWLNDIHLQLCRIPAPTFFE